MKVSILVPVFGVEKYIERCAVSLFEQTFDDLEFIFVNDCTKDQSIIILNKVIERYPNRKGQVRIINHRENLGLAGARLTGLKAATGDYVWFVDSDDRVDIDAIKNCLCDIESGRDVILMNYIIERNDYSEKVDVNKLSINNVLLNRVSPSIWKFLFRRTLLINNSIFPIVGVNVSEDFLMVARIILVAKTIGKVCSVGYYYNYTNEFSYMHNVNIKTVENTSAASIYVYDFYYQMKMHQKYRSALLYMLCKNYLKLIELDPQNPFVDKLKERIVGFHTLFGYLVLHQYPHIDVVMKLYSWLLGKR